MNSIGLDYSISRGVSSPKASMGQNHLPSKLFEPFTFGVFFPQHLLQFLDLLEKRIVVIIADVEGSVL